MASELVSVVIPAYNSEATLEETLVSARAQTHPNLDIIVVDDGSTDGTRSLAEKHAAADRRVRIIHQSNAGVAAARNAGWQAARSEFVAFVDADDLWAPRKVERQIEVLLDDAHVQLVYCWSCRVDAANRVTRDDQHPLHTGDVLRTLFQGNFIGNGSSVMVRRSALSAVGGFDARLRAAGAEGCEDYLLYCRLAEHYAFGLVPETLVGYRERPENMSSDSARMIRSWLMIMEEMAARHPAAKSDFLAGLREYLRWLLGSEGGSSSSLRDQLAAALRSRDAAVAARLALLILRFRALALVRPLRPSTFDEGPGGRIGEHFPVGRP